MGRLDPNREKEGLARIRRQQATISEMNEFLTDFHEKTWKKVRGRLEIRLRHLESLLEEKYMDMQADQLKATIGRIAEVKNFIHMPEDAKARLKNLIEVSRKLRVDAGREKGGK